MLPISIVMMEIGSFCLFVSHIVYLMNKYLLKWLICFYFERIMAEIFAKVIFNIYLWNRIIDYFLSLKFNPSVGRRSL